MIKFRTKNEDEDIIDWEFDSIEPILKEWWINDGLMLPHGDDPLLQFSIDGKEFSIRNGDVFDYVITELSILYWSQQ